MNELYKSIVIQLCQLCAWTCGVSRLRCATGGSERVLALCVRLYCALGTLAKQLQPAMAPALRLERLLKLCGKKLSSVMDSLITYVEQSQQSGKRGSRLSKDTRLLPRLVLEAEQFANHITLLANKAKVNYQQYLSLGTARDFRIKAPVLQEMLNAMEQQADDTRDTDEPDINDAATEIIPRTSDNEEEVEEESDEETSRKKRRRVS